MTEERKDPGLANIAKQAWFGLAFWMAFGLLVEGLIGFRSPAYLQDPVRREVFRLAHAHGTLLSILLLVANLYIQKALSSPPNLGVLLLRIGVFVMPVGFLLGGSGITRAIRESGYFWHRSAEFSLCLALSRWRYQRGNNKDRVFAVAFRVG